ncbi:hypothetical protein I3760_14G003600 [Carya illinoinensis]|nr:hypothetical protein I3760_14G003600 [Carya illinoinensis]
MKRLRSSEDLDSYGDKCKDPNPNPNRSSSSSHRSFYYKPDSVRKGMARYDRDRSADEDREGSRMMRKRSDHDSEGVFDRRKGGFDRYSGENRGGGAVGGGYDRTLMHRSESFCGGLSSTRREFPKGFRSERSSSAASERSRREGSVSSWRRFGSNNNGNKDSEESGRGGSRIGLRDGKSPTWSRDSAASEPSRMMRALNSSSSPIRASRASPRTNENSKDNSKSKSKSPSWSRESAASEQSRSVDVETAKRGTDEVQVDSKSGSEMEEGELEPEPEPELGPEPEPNLDSESVRRVERELGHEAGAETETEVRDHVGLKLGNSVNKVVEAESECRVEDSYMAVEDGADKVLCKEEIDMEIDMEIERELPNDEEGKEKEVDEEVQQSESESNDGLVENDEEGNKEEEGARKDRQCEEEAKMDSVVFRKTSMGFEEEGKQQDKGIIDLAAKREDVEIAALNEDRNGVSEVNMRIETESLKSQNFKDKGKSVSIAPTHVADSVEDDVWIGRETREFETCRDNGDMEGPSTRGFELFSSSPVRREEKDDRSGVNSKQKDEKLMLEPLDLSLSLPNVLLPISAADTNQATPGSPSQARSVQSLSNTFCTNSDGFTASMSFSGSQSFYHNPSCSLTQNLMDNYEQSVGSRPIFQGIEWQGQSQNESKQKEVPLYQRILMNGNGSLGQSQVVQGTSNGQAVQGHHRVLEGSSKIANGLERQLSFQRQLSGGQSRHIDDVRSPSQSVGSHDIGSNYSFDRKRGMREKSGGSLYRTGSQKEPEQLLIGGVEFVTFIARIVAEPVHVMARKFHDMTAEFIACLKESINEIMLNVDKRPQLFAFQKALRNRSDVTMDNLLKSHRAQLEILVALKTGLPDYLQQDDSVSPTHLAEVFLYLKCRNLNCKNPLPVDECDCKVCVQKNGFCSACMCLICSKFDMASNTCSWVGCDVCLHWCHTDCGLRESYIRNGRSATGTYGTTEMQFHCVACDHPSEMFGFVNEVFQNFAKDWTAETLSRELKYVRRIFGDSKDTRGRRLHEIADKMLTRLHNKSDLPDVYGHIMAFLRDANSSKFGNPSISSGKEQGKESNGMAGPSQDPTWLKSLYSEKGPQLERAASMLPSFGYDRNDKRTLESELQSSVQKQPVFDELESMVKIKQAEAKMFQERAEDARREADGLRRIAIAKSEKIEEEYKSRIAKLRLSEGENMRKQKFEEFNALQRAHQEYFNMKKRMEADIKDLLLKMEATKRNLAM